MRTLDFVPWIPTILFLCFWFLVLGAWIEGMLFRMRRKRTIRSADGVRRVLYDYSLQLMRDGADARDITMALQKLKRHFEEFPFGKP